MDTKLTVEGLLADNAELVEAIRRRDVKIALLEAVVIWKPCDLCQDPLHCGSWGLCLGIK